MFFTITTALRTGYSQWISTEGPISRIIIDDVFRHNSIDYLSVRGCGLFSKSPGDQHWVHLANYWFDNHTISGDSLFASVKNLSSGLIRTSGIHYIDLSVGIEPVSLIREFGTLFLDQSDSNLYNGSNSFLSQSGFDGSEFKIISDGLPQPNVDGPGGQLTSFAVTKDFLLCGANQGFFISNIEDVEWSNSSLGLENGPVTLIKEANGIFYCVVNTNLYKSIDFGQQWSKVYESSSEITSTYLNQDTIIVVSLSEEMTISYNDGNSWESFHPSFSNKEIREIVGLDEDLYFLTDNNGLYIRENNSLSSMNGGLSCSIIRDLDLVDDMPIAVDWQKIGINKNDEWIDVSPQNINFDGYSSIVTSGDTIFLSIQNSLPMAPWSFPFIMYSTVNGSNWSHLQSSPPEAGDDSYRLAIANGRLFASENDLLFYTDDLGANWTKVELPDMFCNSIDHLEVHNSQLYISTCDNGELLKLLPNDEWLDVGQNLPNNTIESFTVCDEFCLVEVGGHGIFRSLIDEDNWEQIAENGEGIAEVRISIRDYKYVDPVLFVATNVGVLISLDYGNSYSTFNEGLINISTEKLLIHDDTLYVGTIGNGVWKRDFTIDRIVSTDEELFSDSNFNIYPNPTSRYLSISYNTEYPVHLTVLDINGRKVMERVNKKDNIDIGELSSGIYFLMINHKGKVYNKKFIVNR